jgi:hypothetical protein
MNDPINSVDPQGLCTFKIIIAGSIQGEDLDQLKAEITRIFATGNHTVVFGAQDKADGGTFTVNFANQFPPQAVNKYEEITKQSFAAGTLAFSIPADNAGYVNTERVLTSTSFGINSRFANMNVKLGRLGAHEAITHGFLRLFSDSQRGDITQSSSALELALKGRSRFDIGAETKAALDKLCPPSQPALPPARPVVLGGGPEPPGGINPIQHSLGDSGLDWLYWMWERERERLRKKKDDNPIR